MRWALLFGIVFVIVFVVLAGMQNSNAKTTSVCADIELPQKGKCKHFKHLGYKVSICL